ncbi:MAG: tRNA threonylcarbamoyladenosine dehydratase [Clostridiales Family XIII bacterium]|jgi:tRNA A37 threonylcarbamoyladenosine dehydratase|nr:tRNA threonylcarbamoyladenosine dehydratase [Clostridiales Family XIII bacterium]
MIDQFARTALQFGRDAMQKLYSAKIAVFGVGGVGGYTAEALARTGIGAIDLYDDDKICLTNLNRQVIALRSTVGKYKADVMAERIHDINPGCKASAFKMFYMPDTADGVDLSVYDYVVDAIDTVTGKIELIVRAKAAGVPIICAMGAANKMDPTKFVVTDIHKTEMDPLAKVMRKELRARGIKDVKVVYSKEPPMAPIEDDEISCRTGCVCPPGTVRYCTVRRQIPASNAFVPPVCGLVLAGEVIKDLAASPPLALRR